MITANSIRAVVAIAGQTDEALIEQWLEAVVVPEFQRRKSTSVTLEIDQKSIISKIRHDSLKTNLESRGFVCKFNTYRNESYITLVL